jgi:phosphomannomutase
VIDPANMIGILEIGTFKAFEPDITVHAIFDDYDHTAPNHEANPLKLETLIPLGIEVVKRNAQLGIAFDGDADRVGFVDEKGVPIASDLIGALLARMVLARYPGSTIVCDVRSTRALVEDIAAHGGRVVIEKVGHTNIRSRMRTENAVLGIELSGHFFFKDSFFSEGGPLPAFLIMELLKSESRPLSSLVTEVQRYFASGEINSTISRVPAAIYESLIAAYPGAQTATLDGLSLTTDTWWCNVRPSANDPVLRLNLEATTPETMTRYCDEILSIIRSV